MAVTTEKRGAVTTVILDRPERRNAIDPPTAKALQEAFRAFERDAWERGLGGLAEPLGEGVVKRVYDEAAFPGA